MAKVKTNVMRILDKKNIKYNVNIYDHSDGKIDGISVAEKVGKDPRIVYKTLVTQGNSKSIYVFVIPVSEELHLKKAAKAAQEKNVAMIPVKDILKWTGYIRGGCSPIGMKKNYKTFIDSSAVEVEKIIISGGKIGVQVELTPWELSEVTQGEFVDIVV